MNAEVVTTRPEPPTPVLGPFKVAIEDLVPEATFTRLEDATAALWGSIKMLPLGWNQAASYHDLLVRPGAVENLTRLLRWRGGKLDVTFTLEGRTHVVTIRSATAR